MANYTSNPVSRHKAVPLRLLTASITLTEADSGSVFAMATDAKIFTLPLITSDNLGMVFTIINTGADGNNIITIAPNALDGFHGGVVTSTGLNADATTSEALCSWASGVVDKDYVNTKTTANKGDNVTIMAIATTHWQIINGAGTWLSES